MKTEIHVTPNRERGYDATVYAVRTVRVSAFLRSLGSNGKECEAMHTVNAPSEAKAREMAQGWVDAQPKAKRARALTDSQCQSEGETREAMRNERDYQ